MSDFVLDSSALMASLLDEKGRTVVDEHIRGALMSTVNYAEVVGLFVRGGASDEDLAELLDGLPIALISPDNEQARLAGIMRRVGDAAGLSLGDRFCLALGHTRDATVLTADRAWKDVSKALGVRVNLVR